MTKTILAHIKQKLKEAGVNYAFGEWKKAGVYPYFVGEYTESPPMTEDGKHTATFILNGFHRGNWVELETEKEKIENEFSNDTTILSDGAGVDISYSGSMVVPTGDAELKRIEINLTIIEWRT